MAGVGCPGRLAPLLLLALLWPGRAAAAEVSARGAGAAARAPAATALLPGAEGGSAPRLSLPARCILVLVSC